ncbi:hypothetical protein Nepgr_012387 [Nepenthes gracilis]|uniref:Uncharacterized protein n=1 Tax=Nepenthes gracilis TaxID=150966 RepID=A0AAD3XN97_NEPGR|nr:hypothetical protein Nepgr_012387 [Nepenthes gracilis]
MAPVLRSLPSSPPKSPLPPFFLILILKPSRPTLVSPHIAFPLFLPPSDPSSSPSGLLLGAKRSGTCGPIRESCPCDAAAVPPHVEPASFGAPSLPSASSRLQNPEDPFAEEPRRSSLDSDCREEIEFSRLAILPYRRKPNWFEIPRPSSTIIS